MPLYDTNKSINQPINQSINQLTNQSINQLINQSIKRNILLNFRLQKKAYLYYIQMINIIVFCEVNPPKKNPKCDLGHDFSYILIEFKIMGTQVHFHANDITNFVIY